MIADCLGNTANTYNVIGNGFYNSFIQGLSYSEQVQVNDHVKD